MPVYTVHLSTRDFRDTRDFASAPNSRPLSDFVNAKFVPERFSRAAFFLGPIWLAWQRLWLEFFLWLVVFSLLAIQQIVGAGVAFLIGVLLEIFLGLEANNLRRWRLARHGYRMVDVAVGATRDDAERGFFRRHLQSSRRAAKEASLSARPNANVDVLGVFPLPEDPQ